MVYSVDQFLIKSIMIRLSAHDPLKFLTFSHPIIIRSIIIINFILLCSLEMTKVNKRPHLKEISDDVIALRFGSRGSQRSMYPVFIIKQIAHLTGYSTTAISLHIKEALR